MHIEKNPLSKDFSQFVLTTVCFGAEEYHTTNLLECLLYNVAVNSYRSSGSRDSIKDFLKKYCNQRDDGLWVLDADRLRETIFKDVLSYWKTIFDVIRILSKTQTVNIDIGYDEHSKTREDDRSITMLIITDDDSIKKITIVNCSDYRLTRSMLERLDENVKGIGLDLGITDNGIYELCGGNISTQLQVWEKFKLPCSEFMRPHMSWGGMCIGKDDYISPALEDKECPISQKEWWDYLCYCNMRENTTGDEQENDNFASDDGPSGFLDAILSYPDEFIEHITKNGVDILFETCKYYYGWLWSETGSVVETEKYKQVTDKFIEALYRYGKCSTDKALFKLFNEKHLYKTNYNIMREQDAELFYDLLVRFLESQKAVGRSVYNVDWHMALPFFIEILDKHPEHYDLFVHVGTDIILRSVLRANAEDNRFADSKFVKYAKLKT